MLDCNCSSLLGVVDLFPSLVSTLVFAFCPSFLPDLQASWHAHSTPPVCKTLVVIDWGLWSVTSAGRFNLRELWSINNPRSIVPIFPYSFVIPLVERVTVVILWSETMPYSGQDCLFLEGPQRKRTICSSQRGKIIFATLQINTTFSQIIYWANNRWESTGHKKICPRILPIIPPWNCWSDINSFDFKSKYKLSYREIETNT